MRDEVLLVFEIVPEVIYKILLVANDSIISVSANDTDLALECFRVAREQLVDRTVVAYSFEGCHHPNIVAALDVFMSKLNTGFVRVRNS